MHASATTYLAATLAPVLLIALPVTMAAAQGQRSGSSPATFDVIIRGGDVYDGTGGPPVHAALFMARIAAMAAPAQSAREAAPAHRQRGGVVEPAGVLRLVVYEGGPAP